MTFPRLMIAAAAALAAASAMTGFGVHAQTWPEHPIRFIVPFSAGGANDLIARAAAEAASGPLPQFVLFINAERDRLGRLIKKAGMTAE